MPDSDPEDAPLQPPADAEMGNRPATKRRPPPPRNATAHSPPLKQVAPVSMFERPGRRRRLLLYIAAFATMVALSSMLDLRRAALNARRSEKVHLALPSDASSALGEDAPVSVPADGAAVADALTASAAAARKSGPASPSAPKIGLAPDSAAPRPRMPLPPIAPSQPRPPLQETNLSAQELKDDVDQLIAHVDQESSTAAAAAAVNATAPSSTNTAPSSTSSSSKASTTGESKAGSTVSVASATSTNATAGSPQPAAMSNVTTDAEDEHASSEDLFLAAQISIDALMKNESVKAYLDVNELRTLHALALQGSRGDCLKATDPRSGGSLFKTDAEAAGADIEKTDPLWGAWCLFTKWYRSDAMREYVLRSRAFRARVHARMAAATALVSPSGGTSPVPTAPRISFDQNAASLDDVLSPEAQTALRTKAELVLPHLHEGDVRYLAALSLQATFGDCGPYETNALASTATSNGNSATGGMASAEEVDAVRLRTLTEPLLGRTATRSQGALWGAWCVLTRRKRPTAAAQLGERIDFLLKQLSQKLSPTADTPVTPSTQRTVPLVPASPVVPAVPLRIR